MRRARSRPDVALALVLGAHLVLKAALAHRALTSPLTGDEVAYAAGGQELADAVRALVQLRSPDTAGLADTVVGNGWFMPGMSLVLTPVYLLAPDASLAWVRGFLGLSSTVLLIVTALVVRKAWGTGYAVAVVAVVGLMPMWVLLSFTAWGDLPAGLLVVLLACLVSKLGSRAAAGEAPSLRLGALLGGLGAASLYLRSSALPLVMVAFLLVAVALVTWVRGQALLRGLTTVALAVAVFVAAVLPWSIAASRTLDGRVFTTTTVPLSLAVTFGDPDRLCFGPCPEGNVWYTTVDVSRQVAASTGESPLAVQRRMRDNALVGLTAQHYAEVVIDDFGRYTLRPTEFVQRFPGQTEPDRLSTFVRVATWPPYLLALSGLVGAALLVLRRSLPLQLRSLTITAFGLALMTQPFLHQSSGRYWPVFAPLGALGLGLIGDWWRPRPATDGRTVLVVGQVMGVAVVLITGVGLAIVSAA